jgi:hypothetical protein
MWLPMIVCSEFDGDDQNVAWRQHDVYNSALEIIVTGTNRFTLAARHVLKDQGHASWGRIQRVDHRTLQGAHDILAAAWRWKFLPRQPELFQSAADGALNLEKVWLNWLSDEVDSWIEAPETIRLIQIILSNQNEQTGYAAETTLSLALMEKFAEVAWRSDRKSAVIQDLAKIEESVLDDPKMLSEKDQCPYNTYVFTSLIVPGPKDD